MRGAWAQGVRKRVWGERGGEREGKRASSCTHQGTYGCGAKREALCVLLCELCRIIARGSSLARCACKV